MSLLQLVNDLVFFRIKDLAEKGIKHNEFAKIMGVSPNTITRICNNVQQPHLDFLRKMAITLGVDIRELLVSTKKNQ